MFAFMSVRNNIKLSVPKIYTELVFSSSLHLYKLYLNAPLDSQLKTTFFKNIGKEEGKIKRVYMILFSWIPQAEKWEGWSWGVKWWVTPKPLDWLMANMALGKSCSILYTPLPNPSLCVMHTQSSAFPPWHTLFHQDRPKAAVFLTVRSEPAHRMDSSFLPTTVVFGKYWQRCRNCSDSNKSKFSVHLKAEKCLDTHITDMETAVSERLSFHMKIHTLTVPCYASNHKHIIQQQQFWGGLMGGLVLVWGFWGFPWLLFFYFVFGGFFLLLLYVWGFSLLVTHTHIFAQAQQVQLRKITLNLPFHNLILLFASHSD